MMFLCGPLQVDVTVMDDKKNLHTIALCRHRMLSGRPAGNDGLLGR